MKCGCSHCVSICNNCFWNNGFASKTHIFAYRRMSLAEYHNISMKNEFFESTCILRKPMAHLQHSQPHSILCWRNIYLWFRLVTDRLDSAVSRVRWWVQAKRIGDELQWRVGDVTDILSGRGRCGSTSFIVTVGYFTCVARDTANKNITYRSRAPGLWWSREFLVSSFWFLSLHMQGTFRLLRRLPLSLHFYGTPFERIQYIISAVLVTKGCVISWNL